MEKKTELFASAITQAENNTINALKKAGVYVGVELREHKQEYGPPLYHDILFYTLRPEGSMTTNRRVLRAKLGSRTSRRANTKTNKAFGKNRQLRPRVRISKFLQEAKNA